MSGLATLIGSLYQPPLEMPAACERCYTPSEVAALWRLSVEMIRRLFQNEHGVMVIQGPIPKGKRRLLVGRYTGSHLQSRTTRRRKARCSASRDVSAGVTASRSALRRRSKHPWSHRESNSAGTPISRARSYRTVQLRGRLMTTPFDRHCL